MIKLFGILHRTDVEFKLHTIHIHTHTFVNTFRLRSTFMHEFLLVSDRWLDKSSKTGEKKIEKPIKAKREWDGGGEKKDLFNML